MKLLQNKTFIFLTILGLAFSSSLDTQAQKRNRPTSTRRSSSSTTARDNKIQYIEDLVLDIPNSSQWNISRQDNGDYILFICKNKTNESGIVVLSALGDNDPEAISEGLFEILGGQMDELEKGRTQDGIFGGSQVPFWTNSKSIDKIHGFIDTFSQDGRIYVVMTACDLTSNLDDIIYIYKNMRLK